jgi:hypothetical protein
VLAETFLAYCIDLAVPIVKNPHELYQESLLSKSPLTNAKNREESGMKNTTIFGILMVLATLLAISLSVAFAENENATAAKNNTTNVTNNVINATWPNMTWTNMTTNMTNVTSPFESAKSETYPTNETKL